MISYGSDHSGQQQRFESTVDHPSGSQPAQQQSQQRAYSSGQRRFNTTGNNYRPPHHSLASPAHSGYGQSGYQQQAYGQQSYFQPPYNNQQQQHQSGYGGSYYAHSQQPSSFVDRRAETGDSRYTERGAEFAFKDMLMARYQHLEATNSFSQVQLLTAESTLLADKVIIDGKQSLVSAQPFNSNELVAISTGQFSHSRRPNQPSAQSRHRHSSREHTRYGDEEEQILWGAEPVSAAPGSFDANGQFVTEPVVVMPPPKPVVSSTTAATAVADLSDDNTGSRINRQGHSSKTSPLLKEESMPPGFGPVLPTVTATTNWVYRDPTGVIQGPFANARMHEWYQSGYFPDSLPLRREADPFFDTLAGWKVKCGGRLPFELATLAKPSATVSAVTSPTVAAASSPAETPAAKTTGPTTAKPSFTTSATAALVKKEAITSQPGPLQQGKEKESDRFLSGLMAGKFEASMKDLSISKDTKKPLTVEQLEEQIVHPSPSGRDKPTGKKMEGQLQRQQVGEEPVTGQLSGPKSFADLIGRPAAAAMAAAKPVEAKQQVPSSTATSKSARAGDSDWQTVGSKTHVASASTPAQTTAQPKVTIQKKTEPANVTSHWLTTVLSSSPSSIDVPTCAAFLMDMPSMDDIIVFCQDNAIRTGTLPLTRFATELITRRFGADVAAKQSKACTKKTVAVDDRDIQREREARGDDSQFVSVGKKK